MPSADEILQKMRSLQERREVAAGPLLDVLTKRGALLEQLAALEDPYATAYAEAAAAGWTPDELTVLGAEVPAKPIRKRPRSRAKKPTEQGSATGTPTTTIPGQEAAAVTA